MVEVIIKEMEKNEIKEVGGGGYMGVIKVVMHANSQSKWKGKLWKQS